jgi:hypothetical protein
MALPDGGAAFPETADHSDGLSKRDYFAAAALTGLLANKYYGQNTSDDLAARSYRLADAMLMERDRD